MAIHQAIKTTTPAHIDFLSFTWAPKLVSAYRKLAANSRISIKKYLEHGKPVHDHDHQLFFVDKADQCKLSALNPIDDVMTKHYPLLVKNKGDNLDIDQWAELTDWLTPAGETVGIDISRLDDLCFQELSDFMNKVSIDFFNQLPNGEQLTKDSWQEYFTAIKRPVGLFGYKTSFDLWFNGHHIGLAACGATNGGCYLSFSGQGCQLLNNSKLHDVIRVLPEIRITRLDIALDFLEGEYRIRDFRNMYLKGLFNSGGRAPKYQYIEGGVLENGRMKPSAGCSFYVGDRKNGKLFRAYEKGRQMGDPDSKWVRGELELRSKDRVIPLYALLRPADYFAGAYPALNNVIQDELVVEVTPIQTKKKAASASYDKLLKVAKTSYGALINVMKEARGLSDSEIVDQLIRINEVPRSLARAAGVPLFVERQSYIPNEKGHSLCLT